MGVRMKRVMVGLAAGLLMIGGVALARDGAWAGTQWEYLAVRVNATDFVVYPLVGDLAQGEGAAYMFDLNRRAGVTGQDKLADYLRVLQQLGLDGWEMAGVSDMVPMGELQIFKRPK